MAQKMSFRLSGGFEAIGKVLDTLEYNAGFSPISIGTLSPNEANWPIVLAGIPRNMASGAVSCSN